MTLPYALSRWSLSDLYPALDSPELQIAFTVIETQVTQFETVRSRLSPDMPVSDFMEIVRQMESLSREAYKISAFANLAFSADTQDQAAQVLLARVDQFLADMQNRTLFFSLWWKDLEDAAAGRFMAAAGDFGYWLEEMRHFKPHTLSEPEEKIVNIKNVTGANALSNLYDSITNRYIFKIPVDGEVKEMTRGELMVYARSHDPSLRAAAYQELYRVYGDEAPILGQMYQIMVRDWRNEQVELRHFPEPIAARNLVNDIPDEVVNTLLDVCERNAGVFQRFFRLKAQWLGVERLPPRRCSTRSVPSTPVWRSSPSASSTTSTWTARCAKASAAGHSAPR
jgi:oligoendopeptidase F